MRDKVIGAERQVLGMALEDAKGEDTNAGLGNGGSKVRGGQVFPLYIWVPFL